MVKRTTSKLREKIEAILLYVFVLLSELIVLGIPFMSIIILAIVVIDEIQLRRERRREKTPVNKTLVYR